MASNLYGLIAREKWQLSMRAGYDVGTPATVDYLAHQVMQLLHCERDIPLSPSEQEAESALLGLRRDEAIWAYFFNHVSSDADADSHFRGELLRFGARHFQQPLHEVNLSAELVRDYVLENHLPNGTGRRLAKEFGVAYLLEE